MADELSAGIRSGTAVRLLDHRQVVQEMRDQDFDSIRFASYRTASKLRFIQRKTNLSAVDIWNVIEAFRENGLNTLEPHMTVHVGRLETLLASIFHNLNKRLPPAQQVSVEHNTALLLSWLLAAYDLENSGKLCVFSVKIALATLCAGKLLDKLRYIFSQISDGNGHMIEARLCDYLKEVLALPAVVFESPTFNYTEGTASKMFAGSNKVTVNDFLDVIISDPGPQCLVWLPLLHRMANAETVVHPTQCSGCQQEGFSGFRYKCQKCHNYQLCQECFWKGRISGTHTNDHEVKEYTTFSPTKQIGHSLRKSFRCVPEKSRNNIPRFPEEPEKPLNLSHIVPPSPLPSHNGFREGMHPPFDMGSLDSRSSISQTPSKYHSSLDSARMDDEHRLIARYAARLASEVKNPPWPLPKGVQTRAASQGSLSLDSSRAQRELIAQLEAKNREIMREIARLRHQQELEAAGIVNGTENPALLAELRALRQRKEELESHLATLQDSRRQLMVQLEGLMKMLKNHQSSSQSTPNSSPRSAKSPPPPSSSYGASVSRSAPPTPGSHPHSDLLAGVGGEVRLAFGTTGSSGSGGSASSVRSLRNNLLVAADSVTNAMSSLVRELNSEGSDDEGSDSHLTKPLDFEDPDPFDASSLWTEELQKRYEQETQFLAELQARNFQNGGFDTDAQEEHFLQRESLQAEQERSEAEALYESDPHGLFQRAGNFPPEDEESYLKTEDDGTDSTDWEETMKRWINR